jgi:predicted Zn-dependent protease
MTTSIIQNFEKMLAGGKDNTLLRFALGNEYLKAGDPVSAANHLQQAVVLDPKYSAAWNLLGRALVESGQPAVALVAYREGIAVAEAKGDKQAAKEMTVYARRIEKSVHADRNRSPENGG